VTTPERPVSSPEPEVEPRHRLPGTVWIAALLVLGTMFWFGRRWSIGVPGEWGINPQPEAWPLLSWWQPAGVLIILGGLAAWSAYDRFRRAKTRREQSASTTLCVVAMTLFCAVWPWATLGPIGPITLIGAAYSDISNEYFGTSYRVTNARQFSAAYAERWQTPSSVMQAHVATHPPGAVLFYYGARRAFETSPLIRNTFTSLAIELVGEPNSPGERRTLDKAAKYAAEVRDTSARYAGAKEAAIPLPESAVACALWCQFLIVLVLALAVPAVYLLAAAPHSPGNGVGSGSDPEIADKSASEARGLLAAALFVVAPCLGLFAFSLDAIIATGAVWTLALCALRLRGGRPAWMVGAGAVLGLTSFVSFGAMATGVIVVLASLAARGAAVKFRPAQLAGVVRAVVLDAALLGAGFLGMWVLLTIIFPMQPWAIFRNGMAAHRYATLGSRLYGNWAGMNIFMFAVFCGWPMWIMALAKMRDLIHAWKGQGEPTEDVQPVLPAAAVGYATIIAMLLLTFSGSVRGETERLWFFMLPPLCALAATAWRPTSGSATRTQVVAWSVLIFLQTVQTLFMAATLSPLVRPLG